MPAPNVAFSDRSRHFYELLGLIPFESDSEKIASQLRERMRTARQYQVGAYSQQAEVYLEQLAQARACLLDPQRKAQYDEQLRLEFGLPPIVINAALPPVSVPLFPTPTPAPSARASLWTRLRHWFRSGDVSLDDEVDQLPNLPPPPTS